MQSSAFSTYGSLDCALLFRTRRDLSLVHYCMSGFLVLHITLALNYEAVHRHRLVRVIKQWRFILYSLLMSRVGQSVDD